MTKRTEEKDLFLAALRGDAKAQRTCTEKGKACGGRCIPKHWNCRIKGEGETPPTRGNRVQLSPEQRAQVVKARRNRKIRSALKVAAGVGAVGAAVGGAAYLGAKNPAKARRLSRKLGSGGASEALGVASVIGGPAAAGVAGVANMGVAGFQAGANLGAGVAQRRRALSLFKKLTRQRAQLNSQLSTVKKAAGRTQSRVLKAQENVETQKKILEAAKTAMKNKGQAPKGFAVGQSPRSIAQTDRTRRNNLKRAETQLRKANQALIAAEREHAPRKAAQESLERKLSSVTWKASKLKQGLITASNPIRNTLASSLTVSKSRFRAGRRQVSGFLRVNNRRGPKPDPRSWQERFGMDAEDKSGAPEGEQRLKKYSTPVVDGISYRGEQFAGYNKPKRTPSHPKKSHAVLAKEGAEVRLIRFGQQGVKGSPPKKGESKAYAARRRAFRLRHRRNIAKGRMSAAYWANRVKWDAEGKPCGASHIPKTHKCSKNSQGKTAGRIAVAATAAAGVVGASSVLSSKSAQRRLKKFDVALQKSVRDTRYKASQEALARSIDGLSNKRLREGLNKLPEPFRDQANKLIGKAKKGAAVMSLEMAGYKPIKVDVENNYSSFMNKKGDIKSVGSVSDSLITYTFHDVRGDVTQILPPNRKSKHVVFQVDRKFDQKTGVAEEDVKGMKRMLTSMFRDSVSRVEDGTLLLNTAWDKDGKGGGRSALYRRYGFNDVQGIEGVQWAVVEGGKVKRVAKQNSTEEFMSILHNSREDAAGKPCGAGYISKEKTCRIQTGTNWRKVAAVTAIAATAAAGGYALSQRNPDRDRRPRLSPAEREAAWQKEKKARQAAMSDAEAEKIIREALTEGKVWDVQEKINARRRAELNAQCGDGLGKLTAPAKFDAVVPRPRCQAGEGAFGTYFVHNSEEYGIKLFRNGDEDNVEWEFDRLGEAHHAGVNVPEPIRMNAITDRDNYVMSQTLVLGHMKGYKEAGSLYASPNYNLDTAPLVVRVKAIREFRKLHVAGLAHGDIHAGNIMVNPRSKKVAIIDFGYSTKVTDDEHPLHGRNGIQNLMSDLREVPGFVGLDNSDFFAGAKGMFDNIREQALNYNRDWDRFELAVKRYYDYLEKDLLWDERRARSKLIRSVQQPRIPGITRRLLTANANTKQREALEQAQGFGNITEFRNKAQELGVKPARLFLALKPERDARLR